MTRRDPIAIPRTGQPAADTAAALAGLVRLLARQAAREAMHAAQADREVATNDEG